MVIIETTFYLIFIPDNDPGDGDDDMPTEFTFHGLHQQSKYFGFLASVFCSCVVYLVNKVYCKSLLFLQPLYICVSKTIIILFILHKTNGDYRDHLLSTTILKFSVHASLLSERNYCYCGCVKS